MVSKKGELICILHNNHIMSSKHLSSPESLEMIPELIRYICCVIHPTNEILGSDILPRWAVVGWLLSLCQVSNCSSVILYTV